MRTVLLLAVLAMACGEHAPSEPHGEGLARQLLSRAELRWQTHRIPHAHLHFERGSYAARTARTLAASVGQAREDALVFLQQRDTGPPSELFFVDNREAMARLTGQPIAGMVKSGEKTALFVYNAGYRPFLVHELTHLYTHYNWGSPRSGRWISEGVATLATGPCQGHTVDALAAGLKRAGRVRRWRELQVEFETIPEVPANLQAASMTGFIMREHGIRGVRDAWDGESAFTDLEPRWTAHLAAVQPAELDLERLKREGC